MEPCTICQKPAHFLESKTSLLFCGKACQFINAEFSGVNLPREMVQEIMMHMNLVDIANFSKSSTAAKREVNNKLFFEKWKKVHSNAETTESLVRASEDDLRLVSELTTRSEFRIDQNILTSAFIVSLGGTEFATFANFMVTFEPWHKVFSEIIREIISMNASLDLYNPQISSILLIFKLTLPNIRNIYLEFCYNSSSVNDKISFYLAFGRNIFLTKTYSEILQIFSLKELYLDKYKIRNAYVLDFIPDRYDQKFYRWIEHLRNILSNDPSKRKIYIFFLRIYARKLYLQFYKIEFWADAYYNALTNEEKDYVLNEAQQDLYIENEEFGPGVFKEKFLFLKSHALDTLYKKMFDNVTLKDFFNALRQNTTVNLEVITQYFDAITNPEKVSLRYFKKILIRISELGNSDEDKFVLLQALFHLRPIDDWKEFKRDFKLYAFYGTEENWAKYFAPHDPRPALKKFFNVNNCN